ncbi:oxidoreductase [Longispora urticae]
MSNWTASDIPDQTGRTFVVTGANSGLGLETTRELARRGAHVVMAVRDRAKGEAAAAGLAGSVEVRDLDLSDLGSVRAFAAGIDTDDLTIDVLVNNAGIMMTPRSLTRQGNELQFGTNHLGHFALTGLLLPRVTGRVVTVSSAMHHRGRIHFDDLTSARRYSPTAAYAQSKYANVLFALELDRKLRQNGSPVRSILAHPGFAATNLQVTGPTGLMRAGAWILTKLQSQSVELGVLSQLYAATDPRARGGEFYGPDGRREMRGYPKLVRPAQSATDPATARRLWDISETATGVAY